MASENFYNLSIKPLVAKSTRNRDDNSFRESFSTNYASENFKNLEKFFNQKVPTMELKRNKRHADNIISSGRQSYPRIPHPEAPSQFYSLPEEEFRFPFDDMENLALQTSDNMYSFLCPVGTIFHQGFLVCVWWYDFDCDRASNLFTNNDFLFDDTQYSRQKNSNPIHKASDTEFPSGETQFNQDRGIDSHQLNQFEYGSNPFRQQEDFNPQAFSPPPVIGHSSFNLERTNFGSSKKDPPTPLPTSRKPIKVVQTENQWKPTRNPFIIQSSGQTDRYRVNVRNNQLLDSNSGFLNPPVSDFLDIRNVAPEVFNEIFSFDQRKYHSSGDGVVSPRENQRRKHPGNSVTFAGDARGPSDLLPPQISEPYIARKTSGTIVFPGSQKDTLSGNRNLNGLKRGNSDVSELRPLPNPLSYTQTNVDSSISDNDEFNANRGVHKDQYSLRNSIVVHARERHGQKNDLGHSSFSFEKRNPISHGINRVNPNQHSSSTVSDTAEKEGIILLIDSDFDSPITGQSPEDHGMKLYENKKQDVEINFNTGKIGNHPQILPSTPSNQQNYKEYSVSNHNNFLKRESQTPSVIDPSLHSTLGSQETILVKRHITNSKNILTESERKIQKNDFQSHSKHFSNVRSLESKFKKSDALLLGTEEGSESALVKFNETPEISRKVSGKSMEKTAEESISLTDTHLHKETLSTNRFVKSNSPSNQQSFNYRKGQYFYKFANSYPTDDKTTSDSNGQQLRFKTTIVPITLKPEQIQFTEQKSNRTISTENINNASRNNQVMLNIESEAQKIPLDGTAKPKNFEEVLKDSPERKSEVVNKIKHIYQRPLLISLAPKFLKKGLISNEQTSIEIEQS